MIPIRDNQPSNCVPVVIYILMGINLLVFMMQIQIGFNNEIFFYSYGLVPAKYTVHEMAQHISLGNQLFSIFSYMFLHGGFLHFIGNMWFLYIFGDNVEDHFGSLRFLGFYLISGIISGFFHFLLNPVSMVPTIGASGAIAGVMGAYFLLYPKSRILTIIPIIIGGFIAGIALVMLNKKLPQTGTKQKISQFTTKKHTPKLQMIVTSGSQDSPDLYGNIDITFIEAITGTNKMVTIPWGFYKPLYRVKIPAGVKQGTRLKLSGMGKSISGGIKGDMYLRVNVKNAI
jgi:membrane associated rhomboid family serine protease